MGQWAHALQLRRLIVQHQPDIVQAYGYRALKAAALACRLLPHQPRPHLVGALVDYPSSPKELRSAPLSSCKAITFISKQLRLHITQQSNIPSVESWVIPYGGCAAALHREDQRAPEQRHSRHALRPELHEKYILSLTAPISPEQSVENIAPLLSALHGRGVPAHLVLTGDRSQASSPYLVHLLQQARAAHAESCLSWADSSMSLRDLICASHAVLNLARKPEAYNRLMLEALALGKPVVGFKHGISAEYLEACQPGGAVPPGDVEAMADILARWHLAPPPALPSLPYPYRFTDTAKSYHDLYSTLTSTRPSL